MIKKDLLYFLEDFNDEQEVCFWSNGKPRPITEVKERNGIILLKSEL